MTTLDSGVMSTDGEAAGGLTWGFCGWLCGRGPAVNFGATGAGEASGAGKGAEIIRVWMGAPGIAVSCFVGVPTSHQACAAMLRPAAKSQGLTRGGRSWT